MHIHKITPDNIHHYQHKLAGILKRPNLLGVFSESCGHCHAMKPSWEEMKSRLHSRKCGSGIVELDSRVLPHVNNDMIKRRINGFPTIMVIKRGHPSTEYSGNRTVEDLTNFFDANLNDESPRSSKTAKRRRKSRLLRKSIAKKSGKRGRSGKRGKKK